MAARFAHAQRPARPPGTLAAILCGCLLAAVAACAAPGRGDDAAADDDASAGDDDSARDDDASAGDDDVYFLDPPPVPAYSGGACPTFVAGDNEVESDGRTRTVRVVVPGDPSPGMPLVILWHWLGGTPAQSISAFDLDEIADGGRFLVAASESCCGSADWPFLTFEDPTPDLVLFDDLVACLDEQFDLDDRRVYTMGMSAGGLWTTFLMIHRGERLAAAAPFSGGTGVVVPYETPTWPFPALLTWGGESDTYGEGFQTVYFDDLMQQFRDQLLADGHLVVACDHGQGHTLPNGAGDLAWEFLSVHAYGRASPIETQGLSGAYPEWCELP